MNDNPSDATRAPVTAAVYLVAWKYRRYGPHASLARIVYSPNSFSELAVSKTGHFPRLYLLAALAALEALPEGSAVKLVCSDLYLTKWVFERLDGLVDGTVKVKGKKLPANADLLPLLQKARDRHASFTTELVSAVNRNCEHIEAGSALFRFMDKPWRNAQTAYLCRLMQRKPEPSRLYSPLLRL